MSGVIEDGSDRDGGVFRCALIIDDHPLFCEALAMTLKTATRIGEIRTAATLSEALIAIENGVSPDIVLLDLNLPDVSGFDGLIRLKTALADTPVVVVSSMSEERIIRSAIRAGASGFVPKHSAGDTFSKALAAVARGETPTPNCFSDLSEAASGTAEEDAIERLSLLTLQQARILTLVCDGKLNKQIAHELSIAETTVKAHMTAILRKLGVHSRTQAVLIAQKANFSQLLQVDGRSA